MLSMFFYSLFLFYEKDTRLLMVSVFFMFFCCFESSTGPNTNKIDALLQTPRKVNLYPSGIY